MSVERYNSLRENSDAIREIKEERDKAISAHLANMLKESQETYERIEDMKEHYEFLRDKQRNYRETILTKCLATCLEAIYISALDKTSVLNEQNIRLAKAYVNNYITERGVYTVLRQMEGKTYYLDRLSQIIREAEEEIEDVTSEEEKDFAEVPAEEKDKMLDKVEKEEDTDQAVEMISDRIAKAEEEFIARNKEDKEKIEELIAGIDQRINAVNNDNETSEETKEEISNELAIECKRKINEVYNNRTHTVFEQMVRSLSDTVLNDKQLVESYRASDGSLKMDDICTNAKVMFGWLETVNTLGLENVDEAYIAKVLKEL